jgi:hypothetical protein
MHDLDDDPKYSRYILITCRYSDAVLIYFLEDDKAITILCALTMAYQFCLRQYKTRWRKVKSDNELSRSGLISIFFAANGIQHEPSAPHTQA